MIQHLSPDDESRLAEVLQVTAAIPVTQVTERVQVEPNHVYVVPQHILHGSAGLKRVKEYGGLTLPQDPNEAEHPEMRATRLRRPGGFRAARDQMPGRSMQYAQLRREEPETDASAHAPPKAHHCRAAGSVVTTLQREPCEGPMAPWRGET